MDVSLQPLSTNLFSPLLDNQTIESILQVVPYIGPILGVVLKVSLEVHRRLSALPEHFIALKRLGKDASETLGRIAEHSAKLHIVHCDAEHTLIEAAKEFENVTRSILNHVLETSAAWDRHARKMGRAYADLRACIRPLDVELLKRQLQEVKGRLQSEIESRSIAWSSSAYHHQSPVELPQAIGVEWVKKSVLDKDPDLLRYMVPVCSQELSKDETVWYVARVSHINGLQPGIYKPGDQVAYFGWRCVQFWSADFDILVARQANVRWQTMSGTFSESRLGEIRLVDGCYENDQTVLAIARAEARAHMRAQPWRPKHLRLGKASERLHGAYVLAGEKEKQVTDDYEVLVYA